MSTHKYEAVGTYDSKTDTWKLDSDDLSYVTYKSGLSLPLFIQPAENSNVDLNLKLTLTATDPDGSTKDTVETVKIGITSVADNATVDFGAQTGDRADALNQTIDKSKNSRGYVNKTDETIDGGGGSDNITGGAGNDIIHGDSSKYEVSFDITKAISNDNDGSETIQLRISDVPDGATVVGGVKDGDGWIVTVAKNNPTLKLELSGSGEKSFDIKVQTRTVDHDIDTNTNTTGNWGTEQPLTVKVEARTNDGNDTIDGGKGDDTIYGEGGNDTIYGDDGNDTIDGGKGDDRVWSGRGDDTIHGGDGNDYINGGVGSDTIHGGDGDDTLRGGSNDTSKAGSSTPSNNVINGDDGDDKIWGGSDSDTINGGTGNDTINGEAGDDQLWGGTGNDTFIFNKDSDNDSINDFEIGKDKISIGNHQQVGVTQSGTDIIITFKDDKGNETGDTVTIKNITIDDGGDNKFSFDEVKDLFKDLDSSDFIPE